MGDTPTQGTDGTAKQLIVHIDHDEFVEVRSKLYGSVDADERAPTGKLLLRADGQRRWWCTTDAMRLVRIDAGPDTRTFEILVSPRTLDAWSIAAGDSESGADLVQEIGVDGATITITGDYGEFTLDADTRPFPPVETVIAEGQAAVAAQVVVEFSALLDLVHQASRAPRGPFLDEDYPPPFFWLVAEEHGLSVEIHWGELGLSRYHLPGESIGEARVVLNPTGFRDLLASFDIGPLTLRLPENASSPLIVEQPGTTALLMPFNPEWALRAAIEDELGNLFGPDVIHRDSDGDYPLSESGVPVFARLVVGVPPRLSIFAVVVSEVEPSADLFAELNDLNSNIGFVRVMHHDQVVVVAGDLVAATVDDAEIITVYERVRSVADEIGDMLAVRFGGVRQEPSEEIHWSDYRQTVVSTKGIDGEWLDLNGPDRDPWPFGDSTVHVITAWNPHGRDLPPEVNFERNVALVTELTAEQLVFGWATGTSTDLSHSEDSVVLHGLTREQAKDIARRYNQDAIFEMDAATLRVVAVDSDRVEELPIDGAPTLDESESSDEYLGDHLTCRGFGPEWSEEDDLFS